MRRLVVKRTVEEPPDAFNYCASYTPKLAAPDTDGGLQRYSRPSDLRNLLRSGRGKEWEGRGREELKGRGRGENVIGKLCPFSRIPSLPMLLSFHYRQIFIVIIIKTIQCESKKSPAVFWHFFPNGWELFNQFLHTYYAFLSTLYYKFLSSYLQLWRSYAILSATTQRIFTFH